MKFLIHAWDSYKCFEDPGFACSHRWWQLQIFFIFIPKIGVSWSNLTHIFQMGWNHQIVTFFLHHSSKSSTRGNHAGDCNPPSPSSTIEETFPQESGLRSHHLTYLSEPMTSKNSLNYPTFGWLVDLLINWLISWLVLVGWLETYTVGKCASCQAP